MRNVRCVAMLLTVFLVAACSNNNFDDAYSSMDLNATSITLGGVAPIPLDD